MISLRARLATIIASADSNTAMPPLMRRSREVVPEEAVAEQHDRRQILHTIHFLWGFTADRTGAGAAVMEASPSVAELSRDSPVWTRWCDAG